MEWGNDEPYGMVLFYNNVPLHRVVANLINSDNPKDIEILLMALMSADKIAAIKAALTIVWRFPEHSGEALKVAQEIKENAQSNSLLWAYAYSVCHYFGGNNEYR